MEQIRREKFGGRHVSFDFIPSASQIQSSKIEYRTPNLIEFQIFKFRRLFRSLAAGRPAYRMYPLDCTPSTGWLRR